MDVQAFHLMPWPHVEEAISWPYTSDSFDPAVGPELYEDYLSQLAYCEELGFDAVALNEHHYSAYGLMPSPNLMAANLAARTDTIDIAVYGNVLPLRGHPIRVAEELAMLDNLTDGRLVSGFVRGIPPEYIAYGVDPNESRGRFKEAWELIVRAWTEREPFDFDGEYYQYEDVYIWPRPVQDPHPPLWMPAESEASIRWAAEQRVPIGRVYTGTDGLASTAAHYRRIAEEEFGWTPGPEHFRPARMIYVAEDAGTARAESEEHFRYFYENLLGANNRSSAVRIVGDSEYREENAMAYEEAAESKNLEVSEFVFETYVDRGEIIVGGPGEVTEEIRRQRESIGGFDTLIALLQFGTLPDDLTRKNMELFADEVMPEL